MIPIPIPGFADPLSSCSHLLAAFCALCAAFPLIRKGRGNPTRMVALSIFSFALVFLFSMSGVFHLLQRGGQARDVLQRLDHAGIWFLIAGTITPIQVILSRGAWRWGMLLGLWTLTVTGMVLELVFFNSFPEWLLLSFFLGLGWLGALSAWQFQRSFHGASIRLIMLGGVFYSIGAIVDFLRAPWLIAGVIGPHELFHIFVVLAAATHWLFIYQWSHHPINDQLNLEVHIYPDGQVWAVAQDEDFELRADSIEAMKAMLPRLIEQKFYPSLKPVVQLRYYNEERILTSKLS